MGESDGSTGINGGVRLVPCFLDFLLCPVCEEETRHYSLYSPLIVKSFFTVYCEKCRVQRTILKNDEVFREVVEKFKLNRRLKDEMS